MSYRIHCDASELECTESVKVSGVGSITPPEGWSMIFSGKKIDYICPKHIVRPMDKPKRIKKR